jgi:hypothetical protein
MHINGFGKKGNLHHLLAIGIVLLAAALTYLVYDRDITASFDFLQRGSVRERSAKEIKNKVLNRNSRLMRYEKLVRDGMWKDGDYGEEMYLFYVERGKAKIYSSLTKEVQVYDKEEYVRDLNRKTGFKAFFLTYLYDIYSFISEVLAREENEGSLAFNSLVIHLVEDVYHFSTRDKSGPTNCARDDVTHMLYMHQ